MKHVAINKINEVVSIETADGFDASMEHEKVIQVEEPITFDLGWIHTRTVLGVDLFYPPVAVPPENPEPSKTYEAGPDGKPVLIAINGVPV